MRALRSGRTRIALGPLRAGQPLRSRQAGRARLPLGARSTGRAGIALVASFARRSTRPGGATCAFGTRLAGRSRRAIGAALAAGARRAGRALAAIGPGLPVGPIGPALAGVVATRAYRTALAVATGAALQAARATGPAGSGVHARVADDPFRFAAGLDDPLGCLR